MRILYHSFAVVLLLQIPLTFKGHTMPLPPEVVLAHFRNVRQGSLLGVVVLQTVGVLASSDASARGVVGARSKYAFHLVEAAQTVTRLRVHEGQRPSVTPQAMFGHVRQNLLVEWMRTGNRC